MIKITVVLIALLIAATTQTRNQNSPEAMAKPESATQVTISVGSTIGRAKNSFKVGEAILVTIAMTNMSTLPQTICLSANVYQNLPMLTNHGEPVTILRWAADVRRIAEHDRTCQNENLPERIVLGPKAQQIVDWFTLVDSAVASGADVWYDTLKPGKYELSLQRRLDCCDGAVVQSNKTSFTVVP